MAHFTDVFHHNHDANVHEKSQHDGHLAKHNFHFAAHGIHKHKNNSASKTCEIDPATEATIAPPMSTMIVAVAGITGRLGRLITKYLLTQPHVEVHGIARNPDKLPESIKSNSKVKLFTSDMITTSELREAIKGASILISTVCTHTGPAPEVRMQKAMIDACVAEGVTRFMPSEFTLDWRCCDPDLLPPKDGYQQIYDYLDKQDGRVKGVHVLTGGFMETLFSNGYWFPSGGNPAKGLGAYGTGDEIWELTSYDNAAQYAAIVALDPQATGFFRFLGDRLTLKEIAKTLQDTYEIAPVPFTSKGTIAELKEKVQKGIKEDYDSPDYWAWQGLSFSLMLSNGHGYLEAPLDTAPYMDWIQQETFEDWLQDRDVGELGRTADF